MHCSPDVFEWFLLTNSVVPLGSHCSWFEHVFSGQAYLCGCISRMYMYSIHVHGMYMCTSVSSTWPHKYTTCTHNVMYMKVLSLTKASWKRKNPGSRRESNPGPLT